MAILLEPGVGSAMFARLGAGYRFAGRIAIVEVAEEVKRYTKMQLKMMGSHKVGTATPASPGGPPARISSALIRSIDRSIVQKSVFGWSCRIGTASGVYNNYNLGKTTSKYGLILEVDGCRDGSVYPFLRKAAMYVFNVRARFIYTKRYGAETIEWARIF